MVLESTSHLNLNPGSALITLIMGNLLQISTLWSPYQKSGDSEYLQELFGIM